ncbi:amidohydrolase family protein [Psychrilyobacter sp.]|uniref:dihydroorotase n=1 Tax=Psychrilyobacter sp. TaxID=2586924 RepID=UPI00301AD36D
MLIKNARINTVGNEYEIKDIYIKDGKIAEINPDINSLNIIKEIFLSSDENIKKLEIIDLKGEKYLIPGVIDPHVHMRDPGLTHKEDLYTGSRACAKGGITTFIDMPNTVPTTINLQALQNKKELASIKSLVNYGFYFGGTSTDNSEIIPSKGVASTKVFMNISTGKMLVEKDEVLKNIFLKSKIVSVHAEGEMVEKAITYNEKYGKTLYLCHISNKKELDIIRKNREKALKKIYTEVTPHHLFLIENDVKGKNEMLLRMKPELKTTDDVEALWKAINDGTIDTIGTDHAPHLLSEKLEKVTFGIPGVENSLPLMLNAVSEGKITLSKLIELMSKNPSKIFGIKDRGEIKKGYYGDLVIVDLKEKFILENKTTLSKCGWTPFDGYTGYGKIETTIVNGKIVYNKNQIIQNTGSEIEYE